MFGLVLAFVHWGYVYIFHCIIIEHIPECLVWWDFVSYVSYYPTLGHTPSLSSSDILQILSLLDLLLDLYGSSHWGIPPHPWVYQIFGVLSHCLIYFLIFASRHTGAYPFSAPLLGAYPLSLGFPCLVLISWLSDSFVDLYELSLRASPYCHLV